MGLFGSADAQTKKQAQGIKPVSGLQHPVVNSDPNATVPPTTPGDPTDCATCGDPSNSNFTPFPYLMWSNAFNNKKEFFACDPRHWFGLGTDNPRSRIEIKGNITEDDGIRGLRLSYVNGTACEDLMFEYGGDDHSYIGSLSPIDFHLRTANLPRLSISKTGKIGINNNSAIAQFSVNGNTVLGNTESSHAMSTSGNDVLITDKLSINTSGYENQLTVGGNAAVGYTSAAPENGLLVQGNVGIGTTSPSEKLEVNGTIKATNLKMTGLNSGLVSINNGLLENATQGQVGSLLGITGTEDYIPKFGSATALENSFIRQNNNPLKQFIGFGTSGNGSFALRDNFHFGNFQTLHVDGGSSHFFYNGFTEQQTNGSWSYLRLHSNKGSSDFWQAHDGSMGFNNLKSNETESLWQTVMLMTADRKVGIGTTSPSAKLTIQGDFRLLDPTGETEFYIQDNGEVKCRKVIVTLDNIPDYVFKPGYNLRSLHETETFINQNGHLPEVPCAEEIAENGADLGELNKILLKMIEEMTLHLIRLEKEVEALKNTK